MAQRLRITGRVQGVGYRENMRRQAALLGVTGWVRNRGDGSVEALLDGPPAAVQALIEWARRGPRMASVERVEVCELASAGPFAGFERWPTEL